MSDLRGDAGLVRVRAGAGLAALLTVAAGLGVRAVAGDEAAKYAGDALYTVLLHTLVVLLAPRTRPGAAAGVALAVSWAVEFAQLTGVPAELSGRSTLARLVLGSTFNPPDLFWYLVGALFATAAHSAVPGLARRVRRPRGAAGGIRRTS
ncbi:hypothetical protein GCM10018781_47090 [Kitasatospora indigofera]|uniref:DUF2809 domain-containing protein n=1 Tax=Kitasatospora indigofera TaxID=67307 RepID=A0A919G127_9ACTN|nr:DUF2809 domain-containing protein [Kitasatospora indigofera]GHH76237.1 hypothetical protein GCM10018781_47090 [Kitasatospora indigofera]